MPKASAEPQPLFGDPTNDWAALYEIADVIRKALWGPKCIRLANEPDTDKSSRVEGEDMQPHISAMYRPEVG